MKSNSKIGLLSAFLTVDGEVNVWGQGGWSIFVRTAGCDVGCVWCDTKYSWSQAGGVLLTPDEIVDLVDSISNGVRKVTITGGEPLEQEHDVLATLLFLLNEKKYKVTIETSGVHNTIAFRLNYSHMLPRKLGDLSFIVDYKLGSSKFKGTMDIEDHFALLPRGDVVKFVIANEDDFWEAVDIVRVLDVFPTFRARMFFSPTHESMAPAELFKLMYRAEMPTKNVGINMQMHKYMFPEESRMEEDLAGIDFTKRTLGREEFLKRIRYNKES